MGQKASQEILEKYFNKRKFKFAYLLRNFFAFEIFQEKYKYWHFILDVALDENILTQGIFIFFWFFRRPRLNF